MNTSVLNNTLHAIAFVACISVLSGCRSDRTPETDETASAASATVLIPDSVVQYLLASAADDFRQHQPPTPLDFRNVKIGYLQSSDSTLTYVLCGEFLSKENKEWVEFTTIKTSTYEQYIGKTLYCQEANMVLTGEHLTLDLKKKSAG
ncbi:MAG: hypothetical protein JNL88_06985 [Bacteroidia bacterium]|nr:hypothetical protein [Bacteroidia bacterium]